MANPSYKAPKRYHSRIIITCLIFGIAAGIIFPLYAHYASDWQGESRIWFLLGCGVGGLVLGYVNYWVLRTLLLNNLDRVSEVVAHYKQGDFTPRCAVEKGDIAYGLASDLNGVADRYDTLVSELNESSRSVWCAVDEMTKAADNTQASINQQQSHTEQMASAVSEMAGTVKQVAKNAQSAAAAARKADEAAKSGNQVVSQAIDGVQALTDEVEKASNVIQKLEQDSQGIGIILDVIQGIAEQTNLLALNAAIEAAHAGEQGQGFAVVADEVRSLAQRTKQSTEEIRVMIEQLQSNADNAVKVIDAARDKARIGEKSVRQTVSSVNSIGEAVASMDEINAQIAQAAQKQDGAVEEINRNLTHIRQGAEKTGEVAECSKNTGLTLIDLVNKLTSIVSRFRG